MGAEDAGAFLALALSCVLLFTKSVGVSLRTRVLSAKGEQPPSCKSLERLQNAAAHRATLICDGAAVLAVVRVIHDFQAALFCKPSRQEPLCLVTTLKNLENQRYALAHSQMPMQRTANWSAAI